MQAGLRVRRGRVSAGRVYLYTRKTGREYRGWQGGKTPRRRGDRATRRSRSGVGVGVGGGSAFSRALNRRRRSRDIGPEPDVCVGYARSEVRYHTLRATSKTLYVAAAESLDVSYNVARYADNCCAKLRPRGGARNDDALLILVLLLLFLYARRINGQLVTVSRYCVINRIRKL